MGRVRRIGVAMVVVAVVAVVAGTAGTARAATAVVSSDTITYTATAGVANELTISQPSATVVRLVESAESIFAGSGCTAVSAMVVDCVFSSPAADRLTVVLGDGNDIATSTIGAGRATSTQFDDGPGEDAYTGGSAQDRFIAGPGADIFIGGGHPDDSIDYRRNDPEYDTSGGVMVTADAVADDGIGAGTEGDNVHADIERIMGSFGPDHITGSGVANTLSGSNGADVLDGGGGADSIYGASNGCGADDLSADLLHGGTGPESDTLHGCGGNDTVTYAGRTTGVTAQLGGTGGVGPEDTIVGVENLVGGNGRDTLTGDGADNRIAGGPGGDTLLGGTGLTDGADDVHGGTGTDIMFGYISRPAGAPVTVTLDGAAADGAAGENDNVRPDVETVYGGSGDDSITGGPGNEQLLGGNGSDELRGGPGRDRLVGGAGSDALFGDTGVDRLRGGDGDDDLDGGTDADELFGDAGDDTLAARDGVVDDVIDCGPGALDGAVVDHDDPATVGCEDEDRSAPPDPPVPPGDPGTGPGPGGPGGPGTPLPSPGPGASGSGTPPGPVPPTGDAAKFPAKLQVLRAGVKDGRLDVLAEITKRATGEVAVRYRAAGRTTRFDAEIDEKTGRIRIDRRLTKAQARLGTGILEIEYGGNARVRPDDLRLRAASGRSLLRREKAAITGGRLQVAGRITGRARGVVRIRMGYVDAAGTLQFLRLHAEVDDGRWSLDATLPADAAARGGQLSIQFTGYMPRKLRGEQDAKQVLP